jgi:hypothetical protein
MISDRNTNEIMMDTSAFFAKISDLRSLIADGKTMLYTIDLVVFEFVKLMQAEIGDARRKKREERVKMLIAVRERFPGLLDDLGIEIRSPNFTWEDLSELYVRLVKEQPQQDPGDWKIWLKMQKIG